MEQRQAPVLKLRQRWCANSPGRWLSWSAGGRAAGWLKWRHWGVEREARGLVGLDRGIRALLGTAAIDYQYVISGFCLMCLTNGARQLLQRQAVRHLSIVEDGRAA
jgi:hypothetical protein